MRRMMLLIAAGSAFTACSVHAQVVNIWPGVAPGSEQWTQKERTIENTPVGTVVFNVVTPTLTAYLPERTRATGTGVIIAPGGAFVALAVSLEGSDVARWLQQRGIAAFLLKYRIVEKHGDGIPNMDMDTAGRYGIADGIQALKVVRRHAAEWELSPDRIGFLGFSAGAMVTSGTLLQEDAAARPNFAALIYGGPFGTMPAIPAKLPPMFLAWAQDDPVALKPVVRFHDALMSAGYKPEVHVFSAGGHGFGMRKQGTSSDHWIDELYYWLEAQGFTRRAGGSNRAQAVATVAGYHERRSFDAHTTSANSRVELLEDDRLTATTRPVVETAYAQGERPCETRVPRTTQFCTAIARLALRPAMVRLVSGTGKEIGRLTLERATADMSRLAVSRHDSVLAVSVDLSADFGSYSGPVVRFLNVGAGRLAWAQIVDDATGRVSELDLPTTLKTAWRSVPDADRPEILLVACRPDLDQPTTNGGDAAFVITYSRLYVVSGQWHRADRRVAGIWENDGEFPARASFP